MIDSNTVVSNLNHERFYSGFVGKFKANGAHQATGLCPFHEDHAASLSVNLKTGLFNCFACGQKGDVFTFYQKLKGVDFPTAVKELAEFSGLHENVGPKPKVVATFEYRDKQGSPLYWKERIEPGRDGRKKEFAFYHKDASGKRVSGRGGEPVLYRLDEVLPARSVIIVEGEGKADLLSSWGLAATCLDSGAQSKLTEEMIIHFTGKRLALLPDNDEPGREYGRRLATALYGKVESLKIVHLPGLPEKGDILDWTCE